jgi:chromate transport protein ChrA
MIQKYIGLVVGIILLAAVAYTISSQMRKLIDGIVGFFRFLYEFWYVVPIVIIICALIGLWWYANKGLK